MPRVGIVQMCSSASLEENLKKMETFCAQAAKEKVQILAFPEMAYLSARPEVWRPTLPRFSDLVSLFSSWAERHGFFLLPGTVREPVRGLPEAEGKYFNTLPVLHPTQGLVAKYRKIFLFQANLPDKKYCESDYAMPGNLVVNYASSLGNLGLSICFDLRFPELFRRLKARGSELAFLPASFTHPTGSAHWRALTQARAIENQLFLLCPAQCGTGGNGDRTFGCSRVVAPWGETLAEASETEEALLVTEIDLDAIARASALVPAWQSRRDDVFRLD